MQQVKGIAPHQIDLLYLLKTVCAFFVVIIHSAMWGKSYTLPIITIAVPCFYVISGYFLYSADAPKECRKSLRWITKTLPIYLFLIVFYALFAHVDSGRVFTWRDPLICLVTGASPSQHLWYLNALIQALLLFYLLRRTKLWHPITLLLIFSTNFTLPQLFSSHRLWVSLQLDFWQPLWALFLIGIGYYSAAYRTHRCPASVLVMLLISAIGSKYQIGQISLGHLASLICDSLAPACLLALSVKYAHVRLPRLAWIGKEHSANIYFYHAFVYKLLNHLCGHHIGSRFPLLTFCLTLFLSIGIVQARKLFVKGTARIN